jgi:predicted thioesterase
VTARAELAEIDGRKLTFRVEAFDEIEKIGEGSHQRFIIELEKFRERAGRKSG